MKNRNLYTLMTVLAVLAVLLAACGGGEAADANSNVAGADAENSDFVPGQGSDSFQLMIGTMKLEETEMAVTVEQAASLLPLWSLLQNMTGSDTVAQAEIDAVAKQINAAMTAEQLAYIAALDFSELDMRALFAELGIELGLRGGGTGEGSALEGGPAGGEIPGSGQGGGRGGGIPGGAQPSPEQQATREALRAEGGGLGVNPVMIQALIDLLQGKVE